MTEVVFIKIIESGSLQRFIMIADNKAVVATVQRGVYSITVTDNKSVVDYYKMKGEPCSEEQYSSVAVKAADKLQEIIGFFEELND